MVDLEREGKQERGPLLSSPSSSSPSSPSPSKAKGDNFEEWDDDDGDVDDAAGKEGREGGRCPRDCHEILPSFLPSGPRALGGNSID